MGTLYLVATPIGNLEDISARALRTLAEVALIAAEDTRQTLKLLRHYGITTELTSYHEHNKISKLEDILRSLESGDVALVSDAGTPALNDPGYELVQAVLEAGYPVRPIPGPSAPVAALVVSGLPTDAFLYLGYLPRKSGERRQLLESVLELPYTLIFLETPHRLLAALEELLEILGDRPMAAAREMTKLHEEIVRGPVQRVLAHFKEHSPRGEFTLVVGGLPEQETVWNESQLLEAIREGLSQGEPPSQLAARLANDAGWPRRKVYQRILDLSA